MNFSKSPKTLLAGVLSLALVVTVLAADEPKTYIITPDAGSIAMMPELVNAKAPAWLKPGVHIVLDGLDGTISPDEKKRGGGHGYQVVDVISVQPDAVVLQMTSYMIDPLTNHSSQYLSIGMITNPGGGQIWIAPEVFAKYSNLNGNGVASKAVEYEAAGQKYRAILTKTTTQNSTLSVYRDSETGLLLHSSSQVVNGADQMIAHVTLAGRRMIETPWSPNRLPPALNGIKQFAMDGEEQTSIAGTSMVTTSHAQSKVVGRGPNFLQLETTGNKMIGATSVDLGKSMSVTGPNQLTPLAIDPDDIKRLLPNQELDSDPITKMVVRVTQLPKNGEGDLIITVGAPGAGRQASTFAYDGKTGMLREITVTNPAMNQTTKLRVGKIE